jgi:hypothetical protein
VIATSPYTALGELGSAQVVDCRNATYRRLAASRPGTRILELNRFVASQADTAMMFADSVHLSKAGGRRAARWLLPQLAQWYPLRN